MTWFKVDDKLHDHRKTRRALKGARKRRDAAAIGLWCLAGAWSADNLMDGFVPTDELLRWDDDAEALAERLVDAELWEVAESDGEPGFQFVNWDEHQPTKAEVEAKREAARERMRSVRSKGGRGSGEVRANEQANNTRSSRDVRSTPSRPDPTRPDQEASAGRNPVAADAGKPATKGRAIRLPNDWKPTEKHWEKRHDAIDVEREAEKFRLHAEANDRRQVNWNAAFSQWLLNARPSRSAQPHESNAQGWLRLANEIAEQDASNVSPFRAIGGDR